jgi:RNA polymerase sigma-70 factor
MVFRRGAETDASDGRPVEAHLRAAYDAARAAWPDLPLLAFDLFAQHAGHHPDLHWADLYLAVHCARGTDAAWRALAQAHGQMIAAYARRLDPSLGDGEAFRDGLLADLCTPAGDHDRPRIASYDGRGRLAGWLAAVTYRKVVDGARQRKLDLALEQHLAQRPSHDAPAPLERAVRAEWDRFLRAAVPRAFARLPVRERALIRLRHFGGVEQKVLARAHRLSEWQLCRLLKRAYRTVREHLEQEAAEQMAAQPGELAELHELLAGHLADFFETSEQREYADERR